MVLVDIVDELVDEDGDVLDGDVLDGYCEVLGVEEVYWLGVQSSRMALAAALAEMVAAGEINQARAMQFAHAYLHDTAAQLYK